MPGKAELLSSISQKDLALYKKENILTLTINIKSETNDLDIEPAI